MMDAIKPYLLEIKFFLAVILLAAVFIAGHHVGESAGKRAIDAMRLSVAQQTTAATQAARATEHTQADAFAAIDAKYLKDTTYAQSLSASTVAGLRDGTVRLRPAWQCPAAASVPAPAASTGSPDAVADDRSESAGRIVRAADDADAQIAALQELLRQDRQ